MQAIQAKLSDAVIHDVADVPAGDWQTVELFLPAASETLQIQPVAYPAVIELREISVRSHNGRVMWTAGTLPELQNLTVAGSLTVLPGKRSCLFFSFGSNPIWVLPPLNEQAVAVTLRAVFLIHKDFEAVSEAITALYAEIDAMTAQVRTVSAKQISRLRECQKQAQVAVEEQARLVQLGNQRNAELQAQKDALESELQALRQTLLSWEQSRSWQITRPLRLAAVFAQKLRKNLD